MAEESSLHSPMPESPQRWPGIFNSLFSKREQDGDDDDDDDIVLAKPASESHPTPLTVQ